MNGRPRSEREFVRLRNSTWIGMGFEAATKEGFAESIEKLPVKKPRGKKTYRDGEWR